MSFTDPQQCGGPGVTFKPYEYNYCGADISRVAEQALVDGHHTFDEHSKRQYSHSLHHHPRGAVYPIDDHFGPSVQLPVENHPNYSNFHGRPTYSSNVHYEYPPVQCANYPPPYSISPSLDHAKLNPQTLHHVQQSNPLQLTPGGGHRLAFAGSLDPATGIFYRAPEHPRLRTAQACEKCRTRKAKCSGEHPSCKRCLTRGLICQYAKEGRVRGPNKSKSKSLLSSTTPPPSNPTSMVNDDVYSGPSASMIPPSSTFTSPSISPSSSSTPLPASGLVQPRRNSFSLGESRPNKTGPSHLHSRTMSNLYRLQNTLQKETASAGYTDSSKHPVQGPDSSVESHPPSDTPRDMPHEPNNYFYTYPSLVQAMPHAGQVGGDHDRSPDSNSTTATSPAHSLSSTPDSIDSSSNFIGGQNAAIDSLSPAASHPIVGEFGAAEDYGQGAILSTPSHNENSHQMSLYSNN